MASKFVKEIEDIFEKLIANIKKDLGGGETVDAHVQTAKDELAQHIGTTTETEQGSQLPPPSTNTST
jgi:hypothetical protein